jgi:photosystem II stability/assembly factor-like uncharacterized protein
VSSPIPSEPHPQTPPPVQNNVSGTQNNVAGDQYNAAHDQFVGNRDVSVVENNRGVINEHPVAIDVKQGAGAGRLGCISINVAVTVVSTLAVLAVSSFLVLNFILTGPNLNGISVGGGVAMRGPGLAAPLLVSNTHGWAVGNGGAIYFYNGNDWRRFAGPVATNLNALYYDGTNGWIVGDGGTILYIGQNDAVTPFRSPTGNKLRSVAGVNPAVATDDQGNIYSFNGALWQTQASPDLAQPALAVPGAGGALVIRSDGAIQSTTNYFGIRGRGVIAAGGSAEITSPIVAAAAPPDHAGANLLWAVGAHGSIYGFSNGKWAKEPSPTNANLNSIYFGTQGHGWIVGEGGVILGWNGQQWQPSSSPTSDNLNGVYVGVGNDSWAVGDKGHILHLEGDVWRKVQ